MEIEDLLNQNKPVVEDIKYSIIKTKDKQDVVLIYLNNDEKINVSVESYFNYGLSKIKGLDDNLYNKLKDEERILLGYNGALRKLSLKDCSIKQIKEYLYTKKDLHKDEVEMIINKLINYGLLDDDKYTLNRVSYLNKQLLSVKQIKNKLINEGISDELIEKYVINNSEEEYDKVYKLALKYFNSSTNKSTNALKQNILSKLVGLGFNYDTCKQAIDSLHINNDKELLLLNKEYLRAKNKYSKKYDDYNLKSHIYGYLVNKGFKTEDIKKVMEV